MREAIAGRKRESDVGWRFGLRRIAGRVDEIKNFRFFVINTADFVYLHFERGSSSVGRASASQAEGRGFESRFPLTRSFSKDLFLLGEVA